MAVITSLTTLQTAVSDYLARGDLTTFIPNFIQNWEERFYRDSRNWAAWMEDSAMSIAITAGVAAVPTGYLGLKTAYLSGRPPLTRITREQMLSRYPRGSSAGSTPIHIARDGQNFIFGPVPSSGTLLGTYIRKPVVLRSFASDAAAHWLIVNAPDLCLYGSLLEATPFIRDDVRIPLWQGAMDLAIDAYRKQFEEEDYSGTAPFAVAM